MYSLNPRSGHVIHTFLTRADLLQDDLCIVMIERNIRFLCGRGILGRIVRGNIKDNNRVKGQVHQGRIKGHGQPRRERMENNETFVIERLKGRFHQKNSRGVGIHSADTLR